MFEVLRLDQELRQLRQLDKHIETCKAALCALTENNCSDNLRLQVLFEESLHVWRQARSMVVEGLDVKVDQFLTGRGVRQFLK